MKIKDMEISLDGIHMNNIRIVANNRHSFIIFTIDFDRSDYKRYCEIKGLYKTINGDCDDITGAMFIVPVRVVIWLLTRPYLNSSFMVTSLKIGISIRYMTIFLIAKKTMIMRCLLNLHQEKS